MASRITRLLKLQRLALVVTDDHGRFGWVSRVKRMYKPVLTLLEVKFLRRLVLFDWLINASVVRTRGVLGVIPSRNPLTALIEGCHLTLSADLDELRLIHRSRFGGDQVHFILG